MQSLEEGKLGLEHCIWLLASKEYKIHLFVEKLHYKEFKNSDDLGKIVLVCLL